MLLSWLLLAAAPAGVLLEVDGCPPQLTSTIHDELLAAGFSGDSGEIARISTRCSAEAIQVRIEDRVTEKTVERAFPQLGGPRAENRLAVQVVELLHASLAEARARRRVAQVPAQVDAFLAQREEPASVPWSAGLELGAIGGLGAFGVEPALFGEISRPVWKVELGLSLAGTVHASSLSSLAGRALLGLALAQGTAALPVELGGFRLSPRLGLGTLVVWASGEASSAYQSSFGATAVFALTLGASLWRSLAPWLSAGLLLDVTAAPVPVRVEVPGASTRVGLPLLALALGVRFF